MYQRLMESLFRGLAGTDNSTNKDIYTEVFKNPTVSELKQAQKPDPYSPNRERYAAAILASTGFYVWNREGGLSHTQVYRQFTDARRVFGPERIPIYVYRSKIGIRLHPAAWAWGDIRGAAYQKDVDEFQSIKTLVEKHRTIFQRYRSALGPITVGWTDYTGSTEPDS